MQECWWIFMGSWGSLWESPTLPGLGFGGFGVRGTKDFGSPVVVQNFWGLQRSLECLGGTRAAVVLGVGGLPLLFLLFGEFFPLLC